MERRTAAGASSLSDPLVDPVELRVEVAGAVLAGFVWGDERARGVVLMIPGSGPSTRDNDTCFLGIRQHLLHQGIAVASFDKRGVGGSTGSLLDTTIERQADDAVQCVQVLRTRGFSEPVVVFATDRDPEANHRRGGTTSSAGPGRGTRAGSRRGRSRTWGRA